MRSFEWLSPTAVPNASMASWDTVASAMTKHSVTTPPTGTILKAGGIDLLGLMRQDLVSPERIIDLRRIPALHGIEPDGQGVRIGALATLASVSSHSLIKSRFPVLSEAINTAGSVQIRNIGTVGGNILQRPRCWYFRSKYHHCVKKGGSHCFALSGENQYHAIFDNQRCAIVHPSTLATVLVALGAMVELHESGGAVRHVTLENFLLTPRDDPHRENDLKANEILTAVCLPALSADARSAYVKHGERDIFDWPLAEVAVVLNFSPSGTCADATIVLGAAAPVPRRAKAAERELVGNYISESIASRAGQAAVSDATPLAKNRYKTWLLQALVRRALAKTVNL
jgi:xanthine dehydrogenase YagS FAD-binding subunit